MRVNMKRMKSAQNTNKYRKSTVMTKEIVLTGMFTAVLAVMSQIQIPLPSGVPLTLQTFAVALTGFVLGLKYGSMTALVYVIAGIVGLPVFSGFKGGFASLTGPTGGFILGFLGLAACCGYSRRKSKMSRWLLIFAGILVCHLTGSIHFMFLMRIKFTKAVMLVSLPYLWKDVISVILAYGAAKGLMRRLSGTGVQIR